MHTQRTIRFSSILWNMLTLVYLVTESYITHIRITEDAAYPSTPSPPNSPPENKKPRLIIVALRKSGRVRMHKARENSDGSFSIGKTWMLDDLNAIQSFTDLKATTQLEQQHKQWASTVGFTVTVGKPYYWQAANFKEKDFFIASLVKIYKKYTGGKVPKLIGFDEKQRQALTGDVNQASLQPEPVTRQPGPPPSQGPQPTQPRTPSREGRNEARLQPSEEQMLRSQPSREQVPRSSPSPGRPPQIPKGLLPNNGLVAESLSLEQNVDLAGRRAADTARPRDGSPANLRQPSQTREPYGAGYNQALDVSRDQLRPGTAGSGSAVPFPGQPPPLETNRPGSRPSSSGNAPPSRGSNISNRSSRNIELEIPLSLRPGSSDSSKLKMPIKAEQVIAPSAPDLSIVQPVQEPVITPPAPSKPEPSEQAEVPVVPAEPITPPEEPIAQPVVDQEEDSEAHRPGLGPMIKKKSAKDVAGAFRKAATAYNAFKPRAGGAGERLLAKDKPQTSEPDGITGVVPAPLLRGASSESTKPPTPEVSISEPAPSIVPPAQEPPKVEITRANTDEMPQPPVEVTLEVPVVPLPENTEKARSRSVSPAQERRRRRREDNIAKYCQALNIETSLLAGTEGYFDEILTDLGWNGHLSDDKKIEDLEADIRREIGRVQAISWLGNIEQQEGKIDHLAKLIDRTIEECEELDGLLTLYSHELGVSICLPRLVTFAYVICKNNRLSMTTLRTSKHNPKVFKFRLPTKSFSKVNCRIFSKRYPFQPMTYGL
jgi:exocyst complex component 1